METKGIDLTKCNNCRAWVRYKYDKVYEDTGRIEKVVEEGRKREEWMRFVADEDGELVTLWEDGKICDYIIDFEIVPRDPETYRDWQVGDKVHIIDNHVCWEELVEVIFRSGELVVCKDSDNNATETKTCEQLYREGGRLVLTDIERQIIEEKNPKPYEFRKGEPVLVRNFVNEPWELSAFIEKDDKKVKTGFPFGAGPNHRFNICLPYNEETMHLLGTAEDYKEEQL